jgi:hypothetical protein
LQEEKQICRKKVLRGYFPDPPKSILIVRDHAKDAAEIIFKDLGFTIVTGSLLLSWRLHWQSNQLTTLDSGEKKGMGGQHQRAGHGGRTISAGSLCRTSKVPAAGMAVLATCH